jgi:hypothetical protein
MAIGKRSQEGDRDKPWHKSAANFLAVDAILAAVAALVMQMLDQDATAVRSLVCLWGPRYFPLHP